jgi:hypothetical protein
MDSREAGVAGRDAVASIVFQVVEKRVLANALIESVNTKIRLLTRIAFGFRSGDALIALAMLSLGGHRPALPGRPNPRIRQ